MRVGSLTIGILQSHSGCLELEEFCGAYLGLSWQRICGVIPLMYMRCVAIEISATLCAAILLAMETDKVFAAMNAKATVGHHALALHTA